MGATLWPKNPMDETVRSAFRSRLASDQFRGRRFALPPAGLGLLFFDDQTALSQTTPGAYSC